MSTADRSTLYLSDAEVDEICDGLAQDAARIRFLRRLGLRVDRKPNGRPLVWRPSSVGPEAQNRQISGADRVAIDLQVWSQGRKHGAQAQGR